MILTGTILIKGTFNLTMEFYSKNMNLTWRCTMVYGPNARSLKHDFWEKLRASVGPHGMPWIIRGSLMLLSGLRTKITVYLIWRILEQQICSCMILSFKSLRRWDADALGLMVKWIRSG